MTNVQTKATRPHFRAHTGYSGRRNVITCNGCGEAGDSGCRCLTDRTILDRFTQAAEQLLVAGNDTTRSDIGRAEARRIARLQLRHCIELKEQAARERAGFRAFRKALVRRPTSRYSSRRDAEMIAFMLEDTAEGTWCPSRSVDLTAETFGRPVAYVRDLRDRCLRAMEGRPVELPSTATAARRAA